MSRDSGRRADGGLLVILLGGLPDRYPGLIVPREDGEGCASTWDAALATKPHWIFITSWNGRWEHTCIEPSAAFGRQCPEATAALAGAG